MKIDFKKWYVSFGFGDWSVGMGWWKGSAKLMSYVNTWYDGWWWGVRVGPFFINRGPY
jgi:hypothetical protein